MKKCLTHTTQSILTKNETENKVVSVQSLMWFKQEVGDMDVFEIL